MKESISVKTTLDQYCNFRNQLESLINQEPERAKLSLTVYDYCLWLNMEMQFRETIVVQVPERVRDEIGRFGNFFYPKEVLNWPF